ncbi:methionyl-tRNA formyltransferase [Calditrichota bacterium LG25]
MKLVFMGTPDFARTSLKKLIHSPHEVVAVVTVPDKPQGRGQKVQPSPVKQLATELGLPVLQPAKLRDPQFVEQLKQFNADAFVVVAFKILPPEVFNIPPKGAVNLHASLLPRYRGAAPINWAIINGETETGVTTILINERVDQGNMLLQKSVPITPDMTAGELHDLLAEIGADVLVETLNRLEANDIAPVKQDERLATRAPKITREICHLNFNQTAQKVHNWIRGLSPYPAAYCYWQGKLLKIFRSRPVSRLSDDVPPGTVVKVFKNGFMVKCASGAVDIFEVQLQGKRRMTVEDFLNGYRLQAGQLLE